MKQTFKPKCANHKVSTKGCEICVWARKEEFKTNKFAKKIKEENKKTPNLIVNSPFFPDSEQGVKDYHKWNKRGEGKTNLWVVFAVSIVGWVIGEILFVPFVSAIINSIN